MTKPARSVAVVLPANVSRDVVKGLNARSVVSLSIDISRWQVLWFLETYLCLSLSFLCDTVRGNRLAIPSHYSSPVARGSTDPLPRFEVHFLSIVAQKKEAYLTKIVC